MAKSRREWLDEVVGQIRFVPDRRAIFEELVAHIHDRSDDLVSRGYSREKADERTLRAMGDPVEVGKQLDAVHKPWLGWLWIASRVLVMILLFIVIMFIPGMVEDYRDELEDESRWATMLENGVFIGYDCINLYDLNLTGEIDGYRFTVDKAAWYGQSDDGIQLFILMDVRRQPFAPVLTRSALEHFAIVDDQGLRMGADEWHPENFDPVVGLYAAGVDYNGVEAKNPLLGRGILRFYALRWEPEWVELYCEYGGQTVTFRIPGPRSGEG